MRRSAKAGIQDRIFTGHPRTCARVGKAFLMLCFALGVGMPGAAKSRTSETSSEGRAAVLLWEYPADLERRDLFYGSGGKRNAPQETTFRFVEELLKGTKPKYVVQDKHGVKWIIKAGSEAQPEIAATRFVWAAGYFTDDDYFLRKVTVTRLAAKLRRGRSLFRPDGSLDNVRLERFTTRKVGQWGWRGIPFRNTRELHGLRVLMALLNNWDLKSSNNSVDETRFHGRASPRTLVAADLGSTFGLTRGTWPRSATRGNPETFRRSKFITKVTPESVQFATPGSLLLFN